MALLTRTFEQAFALIDIVLWPIFLFFKMKAVCHFGFLKVQNFNLRSSSEAHYVSLCQISRRSVIYNSISLSLTAYKTNLFHKSYLPPVVSLLPPGLPPRLAWTVSSAKFRCNVQH